MTRIIERKSCRWCHRHDEHTLQRRTPDDDPRLCGQHNAPWPCAPCVESSKAGNTIGFYPASAAGSEDQP